MRFAFADPPYLGQAKKHYAHDPRCAEVNHEILIAHLNDFDGWALSLSTPSLRTILPMCPEDVRVCAWVKPFCAFKANVTRAYAWEPVIVRGGRSPTREEPTVRDWVSANITLKRGLVGAKPKDFAFWLFAFLGVRQDDEFHDLFPGSGAVTAALNEYLGRRDPQTSFHLAAEARQSRSGTLCNAPESPAKTPGSLHADPKNVLTDAVFHEAKHARGEPPCVEPRIVP
jgi:hypothetical protein